MNIHTTKPATSKARAAPRHCREDDCPSGSRNNYFIGKHLTSESYRIDQQFLNGRRHLLNRAVHGWGVVYGFPLALNAKQDGPAVGTLTIGEGLGLDRLGHELWQPDTIKLTLDNLVILDDKCRPVKVDGNLDGRLEGLSPSAEACWLLTAHYAEQTLNPQVLRDHCGCKRKEWDRTCETIVYSLRKIDCSKCCTPYECELRCSCSPATPCCPHQGRPIEEIDAEVQRVRDRFEERLQQYKDDPSKLEEIHKQYPEALGPLIAERMRIDSSTHGRGGCSCLCDHLTGLTVSADCVQLRDVGDCTVADLDNGVALACLRLGKDKCGDWAIVAIYDACGPRRLVKRNDLLFDLINGCDATRIEEIGWPLLHRRHAPPVPFDDFVTALGWDEAQGHYSEYPTKNFWVRFSRPVRTDTLKPDCFATAIMSDQTEGCWREYYRVPIVGVDTEADEDDPPGHARTAQIVVSGAWLRDGVVGDGSIFLRGDTYVEISTKP